MVGKSFMLSRSSRSDSTFIEHNGTIISANLFVTHGGRQIFSKYDIFFLFKFDEMLKMSASEASEQFYVFVYKTSISLLRKVE